MPHAHIPQAVLQLLSSLSLRLLDASRDLES
jgi:hypothetical protein